MAIPQLAQAVSVVIPALNESARIADVVSYAQADPATAEVVVIDDASIDETASRAEAAGARVVTSSMLGKGASMRDGADIAQYEWIVYLDGDLAGLEPGIITRLAEPLAANRADFVKARFGRAGGRVTELTARPMLGVFFPEVSHIAQPLGGLIAARRSLLRQLSFEDGYGVDIGLLLDAARHGSRIVEVDIGRLEHDSQPLIDLAAMANEVARVIHDRARASGRLHLDQISTMYELQRQAAAGIDYIRGRHRGRRRLVLLDMDGTVTPRRFVVELARHVGHGAALDALLDGNADDAATRSRRIAELFRFVPQRTFEDVARALPLRPGVIDWIRDLRRAGFMAGLVTDSWFVAADILRRRVFADFALAHTLHFEQGVCSGQLRLNPAFSPLAGDGTPGKGAVVDRFRLADGDHPGFDEIWAIGDHRNDVDLLARADRAFVMEPKDPVLRTIPGVVEVSGFGALPRP